MELEALKMLPLLNFTIQEQRAAEHPVTHEVAPRVKRKGWREEQEMEEYLVILLSWLMRKKVWETLISFYFFATL